MYNAIFLQRRREMVFSSSIRDSQHSGIRTNAHLAVCLNAVYCIGRQTQYPTFYILQYHSLCFCSLSAHSPIPHPQCDSPAALLLVQKSIRVISCTLTKLPNPLVSCSARTVIGHLLFWLGLIKYMFISKRQPDFFSYRLLIYIQACHFLIKILA